MQPLDLLLITLAAWRLAYLITREDAPYKLAARFRARFPLGGLTSCIKCASIWTAAGMLALWHTPLQAGVVVLAISGGALMLASYTGAGHD